jgi:dTDP-glucose pyrophosphorylase
MIIDDLQSICIEPFLALKDALRVIDRGSAQIALVLDDRQRLLGTLTDGDVRRALLLGASMDSPVVEIMNRHYRYVCGIYDQADVLEMMRMEDLRQIPVLDDERRVQQLLLLSELLNPTRRTNPVVIMAGGKGTRLRPHTEACPKPMLLVGNKPMLEILLEHCIASGFCHFYFSVNYLKEQIIDYFGDGSRWGVSIDYLVEDYPLGTAGSLQLLPDFVKDPFLLLNGDVLTRLNLSQLLQFHYQYMAQATLCVRQHELTVPFGVVQTNGVELVGIEEKPTYSHLVNAGVYVLDPLLLSLLPPQQLIDMPTLLHAAQQVGHRVVVCPIHEYWIDVGRPETLKQAHRDWPLQDNL